MKVYSKKTAGALALMASAALVLAGCSSSPAEPAPETPADPGTAAPEETVDTLKIAALLPQTGSLGFLMPPVEAGIHAAIEEINEAGGVLGNPIELIDVFNEGDSGDRTVIDASVDKILNTDAAFVLGAMSTGQTIHVIDKITGAGILMGSPSNTGASLEGYSPFYFRTAPSDNLQGKALAEQIIADGVTDLAFLTFNDPYGLGLRDTIQDTVEAAGVTTTYGGKGDGDEFAVDQKTFSSEVTAAVQSGAEAIAIVTFDQINQILPELIAQGFDPANVYLVDGNTNDMTGVVDMGAVTGMQGTIPGGESDNEAFLNMLSETYKELNGGDLESFTYGPEAYDLVMITALAAIKGGSADAETIQQNVSAVSGANGGEACDTFTACVELLESGKDIHFTTKAGIGPIVNGDPSAAYIGIYKYDENNVPKRQETVFGEL